MFLTHLHSDHTVGYPDLIFTPWVMGRQEPLTVYGPNGIKAMTENVLKAWQIDIDGRTSGINQRESPATRWMRMRSYLASSTATATSR